MPHHDHHQTRQAFPANRYPIVPALDQGQWLGCLAPHQSDGMRIPFCVRPLGFEIVDRDTIDRRDGVNLDKMGRGVLWLMEMELANFRPGPFRSDYILKHLVIVDKMGFQYAKHDDMLLYLHTKFGCRTGLNSLYWEEMNPRIPYHGAALYLLPDDEREAYFLTVVNGLLRPLDSPAGIAGLLAEGN